MSQVLSQQEIDSLLTAMDTGEIDEQVIEDSVQPKIKEYDFRRPVRLSKEYLSTISMVFEDFAKIAVNQLSTQLRKQVDIKMASIEQVSFDEFVHSVPRFTLMGVCESTPLNGYQIIEVNPQMSLQMVELLCGYNASETFQETAGKDSFTDIELAVLEEVLEGIVRSFESAWKDIVDIDSVLDSVETNPQLLQAMSPNEPVVLATFSMVLGQNRSFLNVCVPYIFFETILDQLSFTNWFHSGKEAASTDKELLEKRMGPVPVDIEVVLGATDMTVEQFLDMEVGDIIQLNEPVKKPLLMMIEDRPYYKVKPGTKDNKFAVEVLQFIEGETEQ